MSQRDRRQRDLRTPVVLVSGWSGPMEAAARSLLRAGTVVVHHDLSAVHEGIVRRTVATTKGEQTAVLELAHGCVSCTLREDVLPLLRKLSTRSNVDRIVLAMDRVLEPEALCWAMEHVVVAGLVGRVNAPALHDVRVDAVLTCLDAATWLSDATGDDTLEDQGIVASADDDRTLAQLVVGQVEYADALIVTGEAENNWEQARLQAVLHRLAPRAPITFVRNDSDVDAQATLDFIAPGARRGEISDAHGPLLRGEPMLTGDAGVTIVEFEAERPFHPARLHEAVDVLLEGVVTARGRVWVASQPDAVLWLESAGGGLRVASAGKWLDAMTTAEQEEVSTERRAMSALRWNGRHGDRHTSMVALVHNADPSDILRALQWALVTDEEMAQESQWSTWEDPFGEWHQDPCETTESPYTESNREDRA